MKRFATRVGLLMATAMLASCWSAPKDHDTATFYMVEVSNDATVYGVCEQVTADSVLFASDMGDRHWFSLVGVEVLGQPMPECQLAIMLHPDSTLARVVNITALMGTWVEPDPIEEGFEMGISLLEGGDASSVNSRVHDYRTWSFYNCKLLLTSLNDFGGGVGESVVDTFEILRLTADSLILQSSDYTFHYAHPNDSVRPDEYNVAIDDTTDYMEYMY